MDNDRSNASEEMKPVIGLGVPGNELPNRVKKSERTSNVTSDGERARERGNEKFAKGDVVGAMKDYEEAARANANDVAARTNLAECYLRGRNFVQALECAERALMCEMDSSQGKSQKVKAMYKKAMALNGLARYADASATTTAALAECDDKEDATVKATLEKVRLECEMLKEQAFMGNFDMGALYLNRMGASFRRCADYVGPVQVSRLVDGRRGLTTTSAVKAGDLLLVQSPLTAAGFNKGVEQNLVRGLFAAAQQNGADWEILKALPTRAEDEANEPPSMSVFRKHLGTKDTDVVVPTSQEELAILPKIVSHCAISGRKTVGVWAVPSFINHSCAPNAHRINVGQVLLVFASRDMAPGCEVTIKYYDTLIPKKERDAFAAKRGYSCNCHRCAFESTGDVDAATKAALEAEGKDEGAGPVTRLVGSLRRKLKPVFKTFQDELAVMKATKGEKVPNINPLLELRDWFENRLNALGLSESQAAMVRMSCFSMYETLSLGLSFVGAGEQKHLLIKRMLSDLNVVDPGGFHACKQSTILANNARRAFGKNAAEIVEATNIMVDIHRLRYGPVDGEDLIEIVRRTEQSIADETGEFCEL